jgi:hypothetical protein
MASLTLLSRSHAVLTLDQVRAALDRALPGVFVPPNDASFVVEDGDGPRLIKSLAQGAKGIFLFHNEAGMTDAAEDVADVELSRFISLEHGWTSIDMIQSIGGEVEAYRFAAKALAQLAPSDAAFLLDPSKGAKPFDEKVLSLLRAGHDPFAVQ